MRSRVVAPVVLAIAVGGIAVARVLGGVGEAPPTCTDPVPWHEAAAHEGRAAAVAGPVADATYAPDIGGEPTFLNLGNPHPDPDRFDVVIYADAREGFGQPPEDHFPGETVCVVGDVRDRDGVPQIIVDSHLSIVVLGDGR